MLTGVPVRVHWIASGMPYAINGDVAHGRISGFFAFANSLFSGVTDIFFDYLEAIIFLNRRQHVPDR